MDFRIKTAASPSEYGRPFFKRSWNREELLGIFPARPLRILDIGAGESPFVGRQQDEVVTIDFDPMTPHSIVCDFTREWPFGEEEFDFIYASHVIEHLYPQDRDRIIGAIHRSLKRGGLLLIRVPHQSSIQGTGWEHYTLYGLNGFYGLTHGRNPNLPMMDLISVGAWASGPDAFTKRRTYPAIILEAVLNTSHRWTDGLFCFLIGGLPEVQALLRRP